MEKKQFCIRIRTILVILAAFLLGFCWVLYDLQIVNGAEYLERSQRKIVNSETVEAARGEILDRYGRVLVSNRTSYVVKLDVGLMGDSVNETLLTLLKICREEGVTWEDTLPISTESPFSYTLDGAGSVARSRFTSLISKMKWGDEELEDYLAELEEALAQENGAESLSDAPSPQKLMEQMAESFEVDGELTQTQLRDLLGVRYELALRSREVTWSEYLFAQDVDIDFISRIKELQLAGVKIEATTVRQYHTSAAAHILGRIGKMDSDEWEYYKELGYDQDDTIGKDGVEAAFEEYLHGEEGIRYTETDTSGKVINEYWAQNDQGELLTPKPGDNITLTLDIRLQEAVEQSLATRIPQLESEEAKIGAAVVIDVTDGGVLALASYPTFDLANFSSLYSQLEADPLSPMFNRATQGLYSPGSTFKMVTAIGALEEGIITPTDEILDTGRYTYYPDYQPQCWIYRDYRQTHGKQNVTQAITNSCNVFFYDVGRRLGIERLNDYAHMFGLGEATGIELYEKTGRVAGPETSEALNQEWYDGQTLAAAIGQDNNQFTPLQLANYIATLVNGGDHWSAHLLKSVKSSDFSQVVYQQEGELLNAIDIQPENLEAVKAGMLELTETGSLARYFRDLDVKVGAKTGSAQVSADSESNALLVCFAPYEDPEVAIAVVVEKGGSGSELGAIAADILTYYFNASNTMETVETEQTLIR